ncbi:MAG: hypothetical protein K5768_07750 [Firmicutes bacterium]|nr:hypothetical protein [Bacillota bacterium]
MKKYFAFFTLNILLLLFSVGVSSEGLYAQSGVSFLASEHGIILHECPDAGEKIYAETTVKNTSNKNKTAFIYLCKYDQDVLKGISFGKKNVLAGSEEQVTANIEIKTDAEKSYTYKAYIWDGALGIGACCQEATFLQYPIGLYGITVGGKPIESYSDDETEYTVKVSGENEQIVFYPKSGAVKITEVSYSVPGNTVVKLSAGGATKTITIKTYMDEEYLYSLSQLKYSINGVEYEVADFNPDEMNYEIELPDNTFYVRVTGTSPGEITYKVQDVNGAPNIVGGVSFGKMRGDTTGSTYEYERLAIDRVIPIKNEETKAVIRVTDGVNTKKYTITFYSKQPRLTEYTLTEGAKTNNYVPIYTSGAGLNNDNGSVTSADRMWTAANVSKSLIGASYFMSPCNNKNANELWWGKEIRQKGDEYFRFTADTAGTVVWLSANNFDLSFEDYPDEVWRRENSGTKPSGMPDAREGNKAYNGYTTPKYFFNSLNWNSNTDNIRANLGIEALSGTKLAEVKNAAGAAYAYCHAWSRHFEAGETVVIRHTGVQGSAAEAYVWAIIWDDVDVNYPTAEIENESSASGLSEPNVIVSYDYLNNDGKGSYNEYSDEWKDLSANSNDLDVGNTNSSGWGLNGFNLVTPADGLELSSAVETALNSGNFTVEFEADSIEGNAAILTSNNEKFSICAENGIVKVYLGSIARNPISLPVSKVINGVNHIVVSSNEAKTTVDFKWYINGKLEAEKKFIKFIFKDVDTVSLGSKNVDFYNGKVCIKKLKIFGGVKSQDDIKAGLKLGD